MATKKVPAKNASVKKAATKKASAKAPASKKPIAKKASTKRAAPASAAKWQARADLGAPIEVFFDKQPPHLRPILDALRALVDEAAPDAQSSVKWGMPFFTLGGAMLCAIGAHKAHARLILSGPPDAFADPKGRLEGEGKTGRHLKVASLDELPRDDVRRWLRTAVKHARGA
jgi:hypothetical protein